MPSPFPPATWEIKSPRLVIRTAVPSDAEALRRIGADPENVPAGDTGPEPGTQTVERKLAKIAQWKELQDKGQCAWLVIALRDTDEVIGTHGFNCFAAREEVQVDGPDVKVDPRPEGVEARYLTDIGITFDHAHWRKGYATEALAASVEHAFREIGCKVVRVETGVTNVPWRKFMHSLGLDSELEGRVSWGDGSEVGLIWKFDEDDWKKVSDGLKAKGKWPL
jgi:RimJ/RimL family protein N-acetyltransferase